MTRERQDEWKGGDSILKLIVFATQSGAALNYFWKPGDSVVSREVPFLLASRGYFKEIIMQKGRKGPYHISPMYTKAQPSP